MFLQLEDLNAGTPLLPPNDPQGRAHCRLWTDHVRTYPETNQFHPSQTMFIDQPPHRPRLLPLPPSPRPRQTNRTRRRAKNGNLQNRRRITPARAILPRRQHLIRRHPIRAVDASTLASAEAVSRLAGSRGRE